MVLIILVNWKRADDTIACIRSLLESQHGDFAVAVCDNSSPDDSYQRIYRSVATIAGLSQPEIFSTDTNYFPLKNSNRCILLTKTSNNLGFAGGNNHAYRHAIATMGDIFSHVWFLNNDTEQDKDCLPAMLRCASKHGAKVGIVGSTMIYYFDRKTVQAFGGSHYNPMTGLMYEIGNGQIWPCSIDETQVEAQMSYVCGASMLVSRELINDVGLMTEDYFLFFEEIDWCQRAKKAGYSLAYAHDAVVYHKEGAAIGTGIGTRRSLLAEYYGLRNKLLITRRFFPWALPSVWLISCLQALRRLTQGRQANAWLMCKTLLGLGHPPR